MLRAVIEEQLELAERIVRRGIEVVPHFRIIAPDGEHTVMVQLPDDLDRRMESMRVVAAFMVWKAATAFVHCSELSEPDAIASIAVTRNLVIGALRRITRTPLSFGAIEWFGREAVGDDLLQLLPARAMTISETELAFMEQAFEEGSVSGIRWVRPGKA